jgi:hypothetical protein
VFAAAVVHSEFTDVLSDTLLTDLGNLLLTLVLVWTYLVWCQFMLIWIGDLPRDNVWWLARSRGVWIWIGGGLSLFHFALPLILLLFRAVKRNLHRLTFVAALVLVMQFVFLNYQIRPAFRGLPPPPLWVELLLPIGLVGPWLACVLWLYDGRPHAPLHDRNRPHARSLLTLQQLELAREEAATHGS